MPLVRFDGLERGRFLERLSRFHARVEVEGRSELAHVPNSGRLRELLRPGGDVRLRRATGAGRLTPYDLVLIRVPPEERGPGSGNPWACIDARLPPRIVRAAVEDGLLDVLAGDELVRTEPPLGSGRADLLYRDADGNETIVETKSITLVRNGAGLFPDSPTVRGAGHVKELARTRDRRRLVVLVVQRPDARAVRVNEPADRDFARELRSAQRAGVEVRGLVCDVGVRGLRPREVVPLETFAREDVQGTLPDHLGPRMRLLICGMNPGLYAAWYGGYYAFPGNRFWSTARAAGLVPRTVGTGEEGWLLRERGIGFTDLVKRPTSGGDDVSADEWATGAHRLRGILRRYRPARLCLVGLGVGRTVYGTRCAPGPQPHGVEGVPTFVVPNPSGRQGAYPQRELVGWFRRLRDWADVSRPRP